MRIVLLLVLACSCSGLLEPRPSGPPDIEVARAALDDRRITFHKRYHWSRGPDEDGGHYEIELASGTCWRLDSEPVYPTPPAVTRPIEGPIAITRKTTVGTIMIAGARYLVWRGEGGTARYVFVPRTARLEWLVGSLLVLVDDDHLLHVGSGRAIRVAGSRTSRPFVLVGSRIVTRSASELVVYDRELGELARWQPDPHTRIPDLITGDARGALFANDREIWLLSPAGKWQRYSYCNCRSRHVTAARATTA